MPAAPAGRAVLPPRSTADSPCHNHATRRGFMLGSGALLASLLVPRTPVAAAQATIDPSVWNAGAYWAFADRLQDHLDAHWGGDFYNPGRSMYNANMLLTHAAAALAGHTGPARQDERARKLIAALCEGKAWRSVPADGPQGHIPGWTDSLGGHPMQHLVVDTEIAWALAIAWRAREALGLDQATSDLIADRIIRTTDGEFWRWPALRLNQINWYARMYQAAASVGGNRGEMHGQLLRQLKRFVDGATRPMDGATVSNLGPGYRFHYLPQASEAHKYNLDSAEYANIVCGFLVAYRQARDAGMAPLDSSRARVVRAWTERVLSGYWTHAGYLNWDTGLGFKRWHQGKKLGLSQSALLGIAMCPELSAQSPWAKHMLDRSFELFDRWTERSRGLPPANAFDVPAIDDNESSALLTAARVQANAAQAAIFGLGEMKGAEPPPLYAYDPDVGRLAVTTPAYNTAIVAVTRGAFPYGGIELARLFDRDQDVAGGVGGRPPASFGVVVRDGGGGSRTPRSARWRRADDPPLRLLEAPRGATSNPADFPNRPYAGAFETLRVQGTATRGGVEIRTTHTFKASYIETEWRVAGAKGKQVEVLFPSWGKATVTAVMKSGARKPVTNGMALSNVDHFHVESEHSGYVVTLRDGASGATALDAAPGRAVLGAEARPDADAAGQGDDDHRPHRARQDRGRGARGGGPAALSTEPSRGSDPLEGSIEAFRASGVAATGGGSTGGAVAIGVGVAGTASASASGRLGRRRLRRSGRGRRAGVAMPFGGGGVTFCSRARFSSAASVSIRPGLPGRAARNLRRSSNIALRSAWLGLVRMNLRIALLIAPVLAARDARRQAEPRAARLGLAPLLGPRGLRERDARDHRRRRHGRARDSGRGLPAGRPHACGREAGSGATGTGIDAAISGRWREWTAISGTATAPPTPTIAQQVPTATFCTVAAPPPPSSCATRPHGLQAASRRRRRGAARRSRW